MELISWSDEKWCNTATTVAERHGWTYRQAESASEALRVAAGEFVIQWRVYEGSSDALESLVEAAAAQRSRRTRRELGSKRCCGAPTNSLVEPVASDLRKHRDSQSIAAGRTDRASLTPAGVRTARCDWPQLEAGGT